MDVSGRTVSVFNFSSLLTIHLLLLLDRTMEEGSEAVVTLPTSAPIPIHLDVVYACDSAATIAWTPHNSSSNDPGLQKCELTYYLSGRTSSQILDIHLDSHTRAVNLFNLTNGESYTAFIVCGGLSKTNEVSFISDSQCEDKVLMFNHTSAMSDSDESAVPTYSQSGSFSIFEWSISVTFVLLVLTVAAAVVLYMWKKYQRRQRILRILRHGQNDPFQALYSPTLDSYSF